MLVLDALVAQRNGNLPFSGGALEQPAKLAALIGVASGALSEIEKTRAARTRG